MKGQESVQGGILKIFLGISAGAGKTYAMLEEALQLKAEEQDIISTGINNHGNKEVALLASGIKVIPTEVLLKAKPALVLVDELAQTGNCQLILELLDAHFNVFTTLNVQHIESLADQIEELCDTRVQKRIPDMICDRADRIEFVDTQPEVILQRLEEGKVDTSFVPAGDRGRFFNKDNLSVLRAVALRYAAQLADRKLSKAFRAGRQLPAILENQRILVAISSSSNSTYLIRWTRQFADNLRAAWTCLYVDTGMKLPESGKEQLTANLTLARSLGANVIILPGSNIVEVVIDYANQLGFTLLVIGKSGKRKVRWVYRRTDLAGQFIRTSGRISVVTVQEKPTQVEFKGSIEKIRLAPGLFQYGGALFVIACATGINLILTQFTGYWSAAIMYLAAISFLSFVVERIPLLIAAAASALLWNFLFIPPLITFDIRKTEDIFGFSFYFIHAIISSWMTNKLKRNEKILKVRELRMRLLNELSERLEDANGITRAVLTGCQYIGIAFTCEVSAYLQEGDTNRLSAFPVNHPDKPDEKEWTAANTCFMKGIAAGCFTSVFPTASFHYIPMAAPGGIVGVIGIRFTDKKVWTDDQESFLLTLTSTISLAVQREILYERNRKNMLIQESERLSRILLNSITHEIKTPLAVIQGCASELHDYETVDDKKARDELIQQILSSSERLNYIMENLLSMNRLEAGSLQLRIRETDPEDILSLSLKQLKEELKARKISVKIPEMLPSLSCDILLIIQVMTNLLRNAIQYSGDMAQIDISIEVVDEKMRFCIEDTGSGIDSTELPFIFGKFFRGKDAKKEGIGLGLSICKGIIEAHGGTISAQNKPAGGFSVAFLLPLKQEKS